MEKMRTWKMPTLSGTCTMVVTWYGRSPIPPHSADLFYTAPKRYFNLIRHNIKKYLKEHNEKSPA